MATKASGIVFKFKGTQKVQILVVLKGREAESISVAADRNLAGSLIKAIDSLVEKHKIDRLRLFYKVKRTRLDKNEASYKIVSTVVSALNS